MTFAFETKKSNPAEVGEQHELLLQAWECAFAENSIIYLSGPLNTGPRFVEWFRKRGSALHSNRRRYVQEHRRAVFQPNSQDLKTVAARLRRAYREPVLEPASLKIAEWSQTDYAALWARVIQQFVQRIVLMPGWEYSIGCAQEVLRGFQSDIPLTNADGSPITFEFALERLSSAVTDLAKDNTPVPIASVVSELSNLRSRQRLGVPPSSIYARRKDAVLDELANSANVAQFVSFSPHKGSLRQEFSRIIGFAPNHRFEKLREALDTLLKNSVERSINIRSFLPDSTRSWPFIYGLKSVDEAAAHAEQLGREGLHIIANETVDVRDGGVSGVVMGDVIEFSPDDTPRAVEKPGVASLPKGLGLELLAIVYQFLPELQYPRRSRVEFSIHPERRGWKHSHTLCWEVTNATDPNLKPSFIWPNQFSRMIGDKVFGLLVAHLLGLPVPRTSVITRRISPFSFGRETGNTEVWTRTSPREQVPGKFTTVIGWTDPFKLLKHEDPKDTEISSVLCQNSISAKYSGGAIVSEDGRVTIEGVVGWGDQFMQGKLAPQQLPSNVHGAIQDLYDRVQSLIGPVRFEWVFDGDVAWIVQLHKGITQSGRDWLVPGSAENWERFEISEGLEALRTLLGKLKSGTGLILYGQVGLTSHVADVIRRAGIPARFAK